MNKDDSEKQSAASDFPRSHTHKHKHREQEFTHAISPLNSLQREKKSLHLNLLPGNSLLLIQCFLFVICAYINCEIY